MQVASRELIRIVFHGRAGNKVMLRGGHKCPPLLRDPRGDTVAKERGGYWRLPEGGRYVLVRRPCVAAPVTLQLVKLVAPQARPDGRPVRLPAPRRGYLPAVEVVVPQQGRIAVDGGAKGLWDDDLYLDGLRMPLRGFGEDSEPLGVSPWFVESGRPMTDTYERRIVTAEDAHSMEGVPVTPEAGQHLLLVPRGATRVQVTTASRRRVSIDGPAITLKAGDQPRRERSLEFDGVAGQYVHLESVGSLALTDGSVLGPDGSYLPVPDVTSYLGGDAFWHLPATGRYRLLVTVDDSEQDFPADATTQVRLRTIRQLSQPLAADGTLNRLATASPGEWVLGTVELGAPSRVTATPAAADSPWSVYLQPAPLHCPRFYLGASMGFCGDMSIVASSGDSTTQSVSASTNTPQTFLVVLEVPADGNVAVDVSFTKVSP